MIASVLISSTSLFAQVKAKAAHAAGIQKPGYESGLFHSMEGTYFDLENEYSSASTAAYYNIVNWLQGRVTGLQVYNIRGTQVPFIRNYPAAIYIDEVRTDPTFLGMLPIEDIALIKIIKSPGIMTGRGGAIAVYTKRGEANEEETEETAK